MIMCPRVRQIFPQTLQLKLTRLGTVTVDEPFLCNLAEDVSISMWQTVGRDSNSSLKQLVHTSCDDAGKWPHTEQQRFWAVSFFWPVIHTAKAGPSHLDALMPFQQKLKELKSVDADTLQTLNANKHGIQQKVRQNKKNEHPVISCSLLLCRCKRTSGHRSTGCFRIDSHLTETLLQ